MSVYISSLPEYTTERYYLLSELEECLKDIDYLNEMNIHVDYYMNFPSNKSSVVVMYLLWRKATGISNLNASLQSLLGDRTRDHSNKSLIIEVLINSSNRKTATYKQEIIDELCLVLINIKKSYDIGCVCLGISDHTSGTPALEMVVKCVQCATNKTVRLYCARRIELLGFDTNNEPDATSNVFQLILATEDPCVWMKRNLPLFKNHAASVTATRNDCPSAATSGDSSSNETGYKSDNILFRMLIDLLYLLVRHLYSYLVFYCVLVVAVLLYYFL